MHTHVPFTHGHTHTLQCMQVTGEDLIRRSDDNEATLRKRLETYHTHTKPLVAFYKNLNLHFSVDASLSTDEVYQQIKAILRK